VVAVGVAVAMSCASHKGEGHSCGGHNSGAGHDSHPAPPPAPAPVAQEESKPVNSVCPIMGGKIDPENVKPELTRQFNGQTIAFCCAGCPAEWDKLTDEQKQEKLLKQKPAAPTPAPPPSNPHQGHKH